jgi:HEAT repeat protein
MSKQAFEQKVAAVLALRDGGPLPESVVLLRKALRDKNNFVVSKAAAVAAHWREESLLADLEVAFHHFLEDAVKRDPQCWAKIAIVKALKDMEQRVSTIYLAGLKHFQMEPVWGGTADTAGPLRGACALALVACHMPDLEVLRHLCTVLADPDKTVRVNAATAIGQLGADEGALPLRVKALLPDPDSEVLGQVLTVLLQLEGEAALPFVIAFLHKGDEEAQMEAVSALAPSRYPDAFEALLRLWPMRIAEECRRVLVQSLAASPLPESTGFLLSVVQGQSLALALLAIESLAQSRFRSEAKELLPSVLDQLGEGRLDGAFRRAFA